MKAETFKPTETFTQSDFEFDGIKALIETEDKDLAITRVLNTILSDTSNLETVKRAVSNAQNYVNSIEESQKERDEADAEEMLIEQFKRFKKAGFIIDSANVKFRGTIIIAKIGFKKELCDLCEKGKYTFKIPSIQALYYPDTNEYAIRAVSLEELDSKLEEFWDISEIESIKLEYSHNAIYEQNAYTTKTWKFRQEEEREKIRIKSSIKAQTSVQEEGIEKY